MRGCWGRVLIETLWNVNKIKAGKPESQTKVLIETLWNVNKDVAAGIAGYIPVLIETLWNVNSYIMYYPKALFRFNRNIVECKFC